ncbi:acyl-CoA/acyl-ACP dehydrogenase [Rhodococcus sp. 14C212]|uniref:acyl-CoA dehydrogenase family protein n=1 Tax=Rhodococcus sp. 14C212 TaxID=2711209 RepID=UPI0013EBB761|nr:acyl-CoA dehydrogenase family protein [Rhodococcus sp. 14C212]NGP07792.1 acyl-CoA/acyl-ACP dehydrogenase [Rhodococcus sp. 14C212]
MTTSNETGAERATLDDVLQAAKAVTSRFGNEYYREVDEKDAFPEEFAKAAEKAGLHSVMIPEEYGGWGLGVTEASVITEEINRSGGAGAAIHAAMFAMGIVVNHGSDALKKKWLPRITSGELRLTTFALTEPNAGTDTSKLATTATLDGDEWVFNGQKVFISRAAYTDLMVIMARTSPSPDPKKPGLGISCFLIDIRDVDPARLGMRKIPLMFNHHTYELFIDNLRVPADSLIGEEGKGFKYLFDGLNAERIVIAAECIGDGKWFIERAVNYANERVLFGKPIGANQAIQHPIAKGYAHLEAADAMRWKAAAAYDAGAENAPALANIAKYLAAEASWDLAQTCMQTHGGFGLAKEYDIERKFRDNRVFQVAPVSPNMVLNYLSHKVLGMPKSY